MWQSLDNYRKLLFLSDSVFLLVPIIFFIRKCTPESLISPTKFDAQSSGIHERWFPKVQAKNQTRIVS